MPVTTRVSPVEVKPAPAPSNLSAASLLQCTCPNFQKSGSTILDTSFNYQKIPAIKPTCFKNEQLSANGFVGTVLDAYLQHNHLVLRPEDVWFAILVQFSFYVNKNSEKLREFFVNHAGKKKLTIEQEEMDLPAFVLQMTDLLTQNIKDPKLREWIMPEFSTTTDSDRVTAAIIMMGTLQKFFAYSLNISCGIPSVTLLGEKKDWEDLEERLTYLIDIPSEQDEMPAWISLLTGVLGYFIETFSAPDSPNVVTFWQRAVHQYKDNYSGDKHITGWLLAFCFWDTEGNPLVADNIRHTARNWENHVNREGEDWWLEDDRLGILEWQNVPSAFVHVPIHIKDLTKFPPDKFVAKAIAGSVGWTVQDSDALFKRTRGSRKADSETSDETLVAKEKAQRPGVLKQIAQKLLCFKSDEKSAPLDDKAKAIEEPLEPKKEASAPPPAAPPARFLKIYRKEDLSHFPFREVPQLSDLSELDGPWEYEQGGKQDTIQPVTAWWVVRDPEAKYGRDPDVPDVQFDSDAEEYDANLAKNGRPLK